MQIEAYPADDEVTEQYSDSWTEDEVELFQEVAESAIPAEPDEVAPAASRVRHVGVAVLCAFLLAGGLGGLLISG